MAYFCDGEISCELYCGLCKNENSVFSSLIKVYRLCLPYIVGQSLARWYLMHKHLPGGGGHICQKLGKGKLNVRLKGDLCQPQV